MRLSAQEPGQKAAEPRGSRQAPECDRRALQPGITGEQRRCAEIDPSTQPVRVGHACLLALLLVGCKHVSELQAASNASAASAATTETHETKSEGPEHIVMTVEEYEQLCPGEETPGAATTPGVKQESVPASSAPGPSSGSILTRRTITVTDRGPSLDDLRSLSSLQSKVNTALQVKEEKKSGPAGLLGLLGASWPLILIGVAILAGVVAFKLKPPWLSFLFKLLGRAP